MSKKEVFSKEYFLLQLENVGAIKNTKNSKRNLVKVRNISIGSVLAAFALDEFSDQEVLKWIRKGRNLTNILSEQFILYRNLANYLMNNVKLKGECIEQWKAVLDSPYVWPAKGENNDCCKLFGYVPDICQDIVGIFSPGDAALNGKSKASSDKKSPDQIKKVEQITVSGLEDVSSKATNTFKEMIEAKSKLFSNKQKLTSVEIDNVNNEELLKYEVSATLNPDSNITTRKSDTAVDVAQCGKSMTSSNKKRPGTPRPGQMKKVEQISVSGLENVSSKATNTFKQMIEAKAKLFSKKQNLTSVKIDSGVKNNEEILKHGVSTTLHQDSNITTTKSDIAENRETQSCNKRKLHENTITKDCCCSLGDDIPQSKKLKMSSVWFYYSNGDVNIPEICYNSVESLCKYEEHGCDRLHSTQHFHWQISEKEDTWYNLTLPQIKCLELAYCKPEEAAVTLERLNPQHLDCYSRDLLLLMGRAKWEADFNTMTVSNLPLHKVLKVRRLCTQSLSGLDIDENQFYWYFENKYKKWIKYGTFDPTGDIEKHIEKHFKQNPEQTMLFSICNFNFSLDFISMKETNLITNVVRQVRRRPKPHLFENEDNQNKIAAVVRRRTHLW